MKGSLARSGLVALLLLAAWSVPVGATAGVRAPAPPPPSRPGECSPHDPGCLMHCPPRCIPHCPDHRCDPTDPSAGLDPAGLDPAGRDPAAVTATGRP